jgi:hypothetical protein
MSQKFMRPSVQKAKVPCVYMDMNIAMKISASTSVLIPRPNR